MAGPGVDLCQVVFDRGGLSANEDTAIIALHCRGVVAGLPDQLNPMDNTNRADFANKVQSWFQSLQGDIVTGITLRESRFYALGSSAAELLGAPDLVVPHGISGSSAGAPANPQMAISITWLTDQRRQWGRSYLPGVTATHLDSNGRILQSFCTALANKSHVLTNRSGTGACLTVWSRKQWTHHDPQWIQVDDVPDVIRSRRYKSTHFRAKIAAA